MKLYFSKQQKLILLAVFSLFIAFLVILHFFFLQSAQSELQTKQNTLKTEQKLVEVMAQKKSGAKQGMNEDTHELQLELPVKPLQEQFILGLQKVETLSNSEIKSMTFSNNDKATSQTTQTNQQNPPTAQSTNTADSNSGPQQNVASGKQQALSTQPSGLQKMTVQLNVESPSYEDFETFIDALEGLKRLVVVENIQYTGSAEQTDINQEDGPFVYTLTVSAFYMEKLKDLEGDLPKIDTPEPAGKNNPLVQYPTLSNR